MGIATPLIGNNNKLTFEDGNGVFNSGDVATVTGMSNSVLFKTTGGTVTIGGNNSLKVLDGVTSSINSQGVQVPIGSNVDLTVVSNGIGSPGPDLVTFQAGGRLIVGVSSTYVSASGDGIVADLCNFDLLELRGSGGIVNVAGYASEVRFGGNGQFSSALDSVTFVQGGTASILDGSSANVFGDGAVVNVGASDTLGVIGSQVAVHVVGGNGVQVGLGAYDLVGLKGSGDTVMAGASIGHNEIWASTALTISTSPKAR